MIGHKPEWTDAAVEAYAAYTRRVGTKPEVARIGKAAARHLREYTGRDDLLLGVPTLIVDIDGVEFA